MILRHLPVAALVAAAGITAAAPAAAQWRFTPRPAAAPVLDSAGRAMDAPFLGGLDVPRPQLVDIDGDGDLDLFLQERPDALMFFERDGGRWIHRSDRWQDLAVGEWYRFADLDGDGKPDLLSESPVDHIRVWRNVGTRTAPRFAVWADTLRDGQGNGIVADRQNILNVTDIDCDRRPDLFIGRVNGTVDHFVFDLPAGGGRPTLHLATERWEGIEILGNTPGADGLNRPSARHGANTMAFADVDADGDQDLVWGDFFEPGLLLIENVGSCAAPHLRDSKPTPFPVGAPVVSSGYNAPSFGDVDGDGDLDLVMGVIGGAYQPSRTAIDNLLLLEQTAPGVWATRTTRLLPTIDVGSESVPALADVDGDGDLDLLLGSKLDPADERTGTITWFENTGTRTAPAFRDRGPLPMRDAFHYAPTLADLDGDGRLDLVTGTWQDRVEWHRNVGTTQAPRWVRTDSALVTITRGSNTTPTFADLDGDGDLDLLVGEASGTLNLYRNVGTRTAPRFELVSDTFQAIDPGRRSAPLLYDLDGDGKAELLLGAEDGHLELWRLTGTGGEIRFTLDPTFTLKTHFYAAPALGDLDGDGKPELLLGTQGGGVTWWTIGKN